MLSQEELHKVLEDMAVTANMCNTFKDDDRYKENIRECPFVSELAGKEQVLRTLGIPFEYDFNGDITRYRAVRSGNIRIEIK